MSSLVLADLCYLYLIDSFLPTQEYSVASETPGCVTYELKLKSVRWKKRGEALRLAQQQGMRGYAKSAYISERMDAPRGSYIPAMAQHWRIAILECHS